MKRESSARFQEMEKLEIDHEKLRDKLVEMYQTYDINTIDRKFNSAKKTEEWAE